MQGKVAREFDSQWKGWVCVCNVTLSQENVLPPPLPRGGGGGGVEGKAKFTPPNYQYLALFASASAAGRWRCWAGCITVHKLST
jgi:hypothetical protein